MNATREYAPMLLRSLPEPILCRPFNSVDCRLVPPSHRPYASVVTICSIGVRRGRVLSGSAPRVPPQAGKHNRIPMERDSAGLGLWSPVSPRAVWLHGKRPGTGHHCPCTAALCWTFALVGITRGRAYRSYPSVEFRLLTSILLLPHSLLTLRRSGVLDPTIIFQCPSSAAQERTENKDGGSSSDPAGAETQHTTGLLDCRRERSLGRDEFRGGTPRRRDE